MAGSGTKGGCTVNLNNMAKQTPAETLSYSKITKQNKKNQKKEKEKFILSATGA